MIIKDLTNIELYNEAFSFAVDAERKANEAEYPEIEKYYTELKETLMELASRVIKGK